MISFFEVRNNDVSLRFSCLNYGKHLRAAVQNLSANGTEPLLATFALMMKKRISRSTEKNRKVGILSTKECFLRTLTIRFE